MQEEKIFFLQHVCTYTRKGIDFILSELSRDLGVGISSDMDAQSELHHFWQNKDVDFFILGLRGNSSNYGGVLDFIINMLPVHYPTAKVIIMAQSHSIGKLKDYLLGLKGVSAVLDNAISIIELRGFLQAIITHSHDVKPQKSQVTPLTYQEIRVLEHLLKGMPVLKVASILQINQKTVSGHKRSALNKLGIPSLHGLMKCGNNTNMVNKLLSREA